MALPFIFIHEQERRGVLMNFLSASQVFFKRNAPFILTCLGAAGVIGTAVATAKATPKAMALLEKSKEEKGEDLTTIEKIKVAGPAYIPAAVIGLSTIGCIFGANILNKQQQASLISAYTLLDASYKRYKNKVKDIYGEEADNKIREAISKEEFEEQNIPLTDESLLFFDYYSLRYFESTWEDVKRSENRVNDVLNRHGFATVNDFYDCLDVPLMDYSYDFGWGFGVDQVEFIHEKMVMDDGLECQVISMNPEPSNIYVY